MTRPNPSKICQKWVISPSENGFLAKSVNLSETFCFLSAEVTFLGYLVWLNCTKTDSRQNDSPSNPVLSRQEIDWLCWLITTRQKLGLSQTYWVALFCCSITQQHLKLQKKVSCIRSSTCQDSKDLQRRAIRHYAVFHGIVCLASAVLLI